MSQSDATFYRDRAQALRDSAAEIADAYARASLTKVADEFEQMAQDIERKASLRFMVIDSPTSGLCLLGAF